MQIYEITPETASSTTLFTHILSPIYQQFRGPLTPIPDAPN